MPTRVVAARRDRTLIEELSQAGAGGFHVVPNGAFKSGGEWIVVLEKALEGTTSGTRESRRTIPD